jgi:2'-5' RNA ligase
MPVGDEKKLTQYFVAIVPPQPVYDEALTQKLYFKEHYQSKASLNSPPHITLHMPFRWKEDKELALVKKLHDFAIAFRPFKIRLNNYDAFVPRVIFMNVAKSAELEQLYLELKRFCKRELNLFNADYKEQAFHPHLTLAFRDLKKPNFERAWAEFAQRQYQAEFLVSKVTLLKHNGKIWEIFREFELPVVPEIDEP